MGNGWIKRYLKDWSDKSRKIDPLREYTPRLLVVLSLLFSVWLFARYFAPQARCQFTGESCPNLAGLSPFIQSVRTVPAHGELQRTVCRAASERILQGWIAGVGGPAASDSIPSWRAAAVEQLAISDQTFDSTLQWTNLVIEAAGAPACEIGETDRIAAAVMRLQGESAGEIRTAIGSGDSLSRAAGAAFEEVAASTAFPAALSTLQIRYQRFLFGVDLIFPLIYAGLFSILLAFGYRLRRQPVGWLVTLPWAAAAFDYLENAAHSDMLAQAAAGGHLGAITNEVIARGYLFSTVKFAFLLLSLLLISAAGYRYLFLGTRRRKIIGLLLSFLLFLGLGWVMSGRTGPAFRGASCPGHLRMEFLIRPDQAGNIIDCWLRARESASGAAGDTFGAVAGAYASHLALDTLWALFGYAPLLAGVILLLSSGKRTWISKAVFVPWSAAWLDGLENLLHVDMLRSVQILECSGCIPSGLLSASYLVSLLKWFLLLVSVIVLLWAAAVAVRRDPGSERDYPYPAVPFGQANSFVRPFDLRGWRETVLGDGSAGKPGSEYGYVNLRREAAARGNAGQGQLGWPVCLNPVDNTDNRRRAIGLAQSGGGIRSGTFNLGLLQGLSRFGIMPWVDYISSVSGGGFSAGALTSLLSAQKADGSFHFRTGWDAFPFNPQIMAFDPAGGTGGSTAGNDPAGTGKGAYRGVSTRKGLNTQLAHLRNQGNYLTPRLGWITRDILRVIGAIFGNMTYTVLLFAAAMLVLSGLHYLALGTLTPVIRTDIDLVRQESSATSDQGFETSASPLEADSGEAPGPEPESMPRFETLGLLFGDYSTSPGAAEVEDAIPVPWMPYLLALAAGIVIAIPYWRAVGEFYWTHMRNPFSEVATPVLERVRRQIVRFARWTYVVLFVPWLLLLIIAGPWMPGGERFSDFYWMWGWLFLLLMLIYTFGYLNQQLKDHRWLEGGLAPLNHFDNLFISITLGFFAGMAFLTVLALRRWTSPGDPGGPAIFWIWMIPVFFLGNLVGVLILSVFKFRRPVTSPDGSKAAEQVALISFWSNTSFRSIFWSWQGMNLYAILIIVLLNLVALPSFFATAANEQTGAVTLLTALVSGSYAAFLANANSQTVSGASNLLVRVFRLPEGIRNYVLGLMVIVFLLAVLAFFESIFDLANPGNLALTAGIGCLALVVFSLVGWKVQFNYSTPHYFFRDQLAAAFLKTEVEDPIGALYTARDDRSLRMHQINPDGSDAPYHLVQTGINLPGSWHLENKDRKAQSFIFSRHFTGSEITGYVRTERYRATYNSAGLTKYSRALALSGAAVSPSLGLHTFFAQAFMATLLNLRLGLWMLNPRLYKLPTIKMDGAPDEKWFYDRFENRVFWPTYLWDELRGRAHERRALVNLSDGAVSGDNIGLYPLLKRRCQLIIAGDASGDPEFRCTDLFRVLQQAELEFGLRVEIDLKALQPLEQDEGAQKKGWSKRHCVIAKIHYAQDDLNGFQEQTGWLVYFKPAVTGDDPESILKYWAAHKADFPHPTTVDQFFEEAQFEAQRYLGEFSVIHTLRSWRRFCERKRVSLKEEIAALKSQVLEYERKMAEIERNRRLSRREKRIREAYEAEIEQREKTVKKKNRQLARYAALIQFLPQTDRIEASQDAIAAGDIGSLMTHFDSLDELMEALRAATLE